MEDGADERRKKGGTEDMFDGLDVFSLENSVAEVPGPEVEVGVGVGVGVGAGVPSAPYDEGSMGVMMPGLDDVDTGWGMGGLEEGAYGSIEGAGYPSLYFGLGMDASGRDKREEKPREKWKDKERATSVPLPVEKRITKRESRRTKVGPVHSRVKKDEDIAVSTDVPHGMSGTGDPMEPSLGADYQLHGEALDDLETTTASANDRRDSDLLTLVRRLEATIASLDVSARLCLRDALVSLSNKAANPTMLPTPEQEAMNRAAEYLVLRMLFLTGQHFMHTAPGTTQSTFMAPNVPVTVGGFVPGAPLMPDHGSTPQVVPGFMPNMVPPAVGMPPTAQTPLQPFPPQRTASSPPLSSPHASPQSTQSSPHLRQQQQQQQRQQQQRQQQQQQQQQRQQRQDQQRQQQRRQQLFSRQAQPPLVGSSRTSSSLSAKAEASLQAQNSDLGAL